MFLPCICERLSGLSQMLADNLPISACVCKCAISDMACAGVLQNPGEEKFRRIKLSNAAFQNRVAVLPATLQFLGHVGFEKDAAGESLFLQQAAARPEVLNAAGEVLTNALTNPMFGVL